MSRSTAIRLGKSLSKSEKRQFKLLSRGEFNIKRFRAKDIRRRIKGLSHSQISRILRRLRVLGIIKKVRNTYKYYLTKLGKTAKITGLNLKNMVNTP